MKKLFFIDECDWVVAKSVGDAKDFYQTETGSSDEEISEMEFEEIPEEQWSEESWSMDENDEAGNPIVLTCTEYLERFDENEPAVVACAEQ